VPSPPPQGQPLDIVALIPALNEEVALPGVLVGLHAAGVSRVVVVDNGSTDGTGRVAREGGAEVLTEPERGYGAACLAGLRYLEVNAPDVVVFLDGDQSDDPAAMDRILDPIRAGRADFVIGVRRGARSGEVSSVPLHARLGTGLILAAARLLHGARFRDLGPFRAIRFQSLRALDMDDRNWGWTLQMQLRAHHLGVPMEEVEVPHRPRAAGRSKVSGSPIGSLKAGGKMLITLIRERFRALLPRATPGT
jgi:hypothetical protein